MINIEDLKVGQLIKTYGQIVRIESIERNVIYLEYPIIVPHMIYTKDWINIHEVSELISKNKTNFL